MNRQLTNRDAPLLFRVLGANGLFSTVSGLIMVVGAKPVSLWMGLGSHYWLLGLGLVLVGFGGSLLFHWWRRRVSRAEALAISALDLGWVLGSALLLLLAPQWLRPEGTWMIVGIGLVVLVFFELQALALWRARSKLAA